jgi:hypothetical protein
MKLEPVLRVTVKVEKPVTTGVTPHGELRLITFDEGRFEGSGVRGRLVPGGTDWQRIREDGTLEIRAHYMLESDDGETIEVISEGLRAASADVLARLAAGEDVAPDDYYFRTFIRLATAAPRLREWNDRLFIGVGVRKAHDVEITIHEVP